MNVGKYSFTPNNVEFTQKRITRISRKICRLALLPSRDVLYALYLYTAELTAVVTRYVEVACCSSFITGPK